MKDLYHRKRERERERGEKKIDQNEVSRIMMLQLDATIYTPIIVYKFITIINIINISNDDEKYLHSLLRNILV